MPTIHSKQSAIVEGILLLSSLAVSSIVASLIISKLLSIFPQYIAVVMGLLSFIESFQ
jgi:hypothetical protein